MGMYAEAVFTKIVASRTIDDVHRACIAKNFSLRTNPPNRLGALHTIRKNSKAIATVLGIEQGMIVFKSHGYYLWGLRGLDKLSRVLP